MKLMPNVVIETSVFATSCYLLKYHLWHFGQKWNRLIYEEKQVNIEEFIRLKDAYVNKQPNYK